MTVKRRFKTLMLRKKKRHSDAVAAASAILCTNGDDTIPVPETVSPIPLTGNSNGPIDLNCDPNREDVEVEAKRLKITNLGSFPCLSNFQHGDQSSELHLVAQANNGVSVPAVEESESSTDEEGDEVEDDEETGDEQLPPPSDNNTTSPPPRPHSDQINPDID